MYEENTPASDPTGREVRDERENGKDGCGIRQDDAPIATPIVIQSPVQRHDKDLQAPSPETRVPPPLREGDACTGVRGETQPPIPHSDLPVEHCSSERPHAKRGDAQ